MDIQQLTFGSFIASEIAQETALKQSYQINILIEEKNAIQRDFTRRLVERENTLQAERDAFVLSVTATVEKYRRENETLRHELQLLREAAADLSQSTEPLDHLITVLKTETDTQCVENTVHAADLHSKLELAETEKANIVEELACAKSSICNLKGIIETMKVENEEDRQALIRFKQSASKQNARSNSTPEGASKVKKLEAELKEEKLLYESLNCKTAQLERANVSTASRLKEAEDSARFIAGELLQLSHLPAIIDAIQTYLKHETTQMYECGTKGGLEEFARRALAFLRAYRAGSLDTVIQTAVKKRQLELKTNLLNGFQNGEHIIRDDLRNKYLADFETWKTQLEILMEQEDAKKLQAQNSV